MHFARLAIEAQGELFLAVDEGQGLGAHLPLNACHPLGLLGAQAHGEAHTVLGDHQADFTLFFVAFVGRSNQFDAMLGVKIAGLVVVNVGQVSQRVFRVERRRFDGSAWYRALVLGRANKLQRGQGIASQGVEL